MIFSHLLSARPSNGSGVPTQPRKRVSLYQRSGQLLLSALTPLLLGGAIALPAVMVAEVVQAQEQGEFFDFRRDLQEGDRGRDVLVLQRELVRRGLLFIDIPDRAQVGYFGPDTKDAVRRFQQNEGTPYTDGVVGQQTLRRLFSVGLVPTQAYSIAMMQAQLEELGYYRQAVDGVFGSATATALRNLNDEAFVPVSSQSDPQTLENTFKTVEDYYNTQRVRRNLPHVSVLDQRVKNRVPESRLLAYGTLSPDRSSSGGGGGQGGQYPERSRIQGAPYVVIVPLNNNPNRFWDVKGLVPEAIRVADRKGDYVQVGAFSDRGNAEEWVNYLQTEGFRDARVIFD